MPMTDTIQREGERVPLAQADVNDNRHVEGVRAGTLVSLLKAWKEKVDTVLENERRFEASMERMEAKFTRMLENQVTLAKNLKVINDRLKRVEAMVCREPGDACAQPEGLRATVHEPNKEHQ